MVTEQEPIVGGSAEAEESDDIQMSEEKAPNSEVHAYNKRLKKRVKDLEGRRMTDDLDVIGLQPDAGLGLAISETYKGDFTDGDVAEFARTKYGHDSAVAQQVPAEVAQGDRLEQLGGSADPIVPQQAPVPGQDAINLMEANDPEASRQDALDSIAAKSAQFNEEFYPQK